MQEKAISAPPHVEMVSEDKFPEYRWWRWFVQLVNVLAKIQTYSVTLNPPSIPAGDTYEDTVAVSGLETNDIIFLSKQTYDSGVAAVHARCSASGVLAVTFVNPTGSAVDPGEATYLVCAIRL